jgi:hypothetical protein
MGLNPTDAQKNLLRMNVFLDGLLDRRVIVQHSTRIKFADDRLGRRAARVAQILNSELEHFWKQLADGRSNADANRYDQARRHARSLGYDYIPNSELIAFPPEKRLERLEALVAKGLTKDPGAREALLGTAPRPSFQLSRLFEEYESATKDEVKDMSPDQLRIWRNGRMRAVAQFAQVVGDKPVGDLTHADAIDYSEWWRARVVEDGHICVRQAVPKNFLERLAGACHTVRIKENIKPGHIERLV